MFVKIQEIIASISDSNEATARLKGLGRGAIALTGVLFLAYVVASMTSMVIMKQFSQMALESLSFGAQSRASQQGSQFVVRSQLNHLDLRRSVLDRNVFNSSGEVPDESDIEQPDQQLSTSDFDLDAPCQNPTVNVELIGTIFLGNPFQSLAIVRERGYSQSDVYRVGEALIGNEGAVFIKVEQKSAILNHNGAKECLELVEPTGPTVASTSPSSRPERRDVDDTSRDRLQNGAERTVSLQASYVEQQLGEGFSEILKKGRLVPANDPQSNSMQGFRLIGLVPDSLFGRVGLQNGDVITQVNDVSLQQPDQGFEFYQVFQDYREIRISLLRNGTEPVTINVRIE